MRLLEQEKRGQRERAAFALAATYLGGPSINRSLSSSPIRPAGSRGGLSTRSRPASARSNNSRLALQRSAGVVPSARPRSGWVVNNDTLEVEFRKRREDTAQRRRAMRGMAGDAECFGGVAVDLQTLEDENQRLKLALNKASEEIRKYQVHRVRLEGELLRADGRVEVLLAELEQAPGQRDQRALNAARCDVEKCAVVRTLAKQKGRLQHLLARRERELEDLKRTKEWSTVAEMTAATEEYLTEIQRLQRLLLVARQNVVQSSAAANSANDTWDCTRDEYTPAGSGSTRLDRFTQAHDTTRWYPRPELESVEVHTAHRERRRSSGIDDTLWSQRLDSDRGSACATPNNARGTQVVPGIDTFVSCGMYEEYQRSKAPAQERDTASEIPGGDLLEQASGTGHQQRPSSPMRRVPPSRPARMATRAATRAMFGGRVGTSVPRSSHSRTSSLKRPNIASREPEQDSRRRGGGGRGGSPHSEAKSRGQALKRWVSAGARNGDSTQARLRGRPLSAPSHRRRAEERPEPASLSTDGRRVSWGRSSHHTLYTAGEQRHEEVISTSFSPNSGVDGATRPRSSMGTRDTGRARITPGRERAADGNRFNHGETQKEADAITTVVAYPSPRRGVCEAEREGKPATPVNGARATAAPAAEGQEGRRGIYYHSKAREGDGGGWRVHSPSEACQKGDGDRRGCDEWTGEDGISAVPGHHSDFGEGTTDGATKALVSSQHEEKRMTGRDASSALGSHCVNGMMITDTSDERARYVLKQEGFVGAQGGADATPAENKVGPAPSRGGASAHSHEHSVDAAEIPTAGDRTNEIGATLQPSLFREGTPSSAKTAGHKNTKTISSPARSVNSEKLMPMSSWSSPSARKKEKKESPRATGAYSDGGSDTAGSVSQGIGVSTRSTTGRRYPEEGGADLPALERPLSVESNSRGVDHREESDDELCSVEGPLPLEPLLVEEVTMSPGKAAAATHGRDTMLAEETEHKENTGTNGTAHGSGDIAEDVENAIDGNESVIWDAEMDPPLSESVSSSAALHRIRGRSDNVGVATADRTTAHKKGGDARDPATAVALKDDAVPPSDGSGSISSGIPPLVVGRQRGATEAGIAGNVAGVGGGNGEGPGSETGGEPSEYGDDFDEEED